MTDETLPETTADTAVLDSDLPIDPDDPDQSPGDEAERIEAETPAGPPLSVAIVGCGIIGVNHARAIARHPELTITALVDAVPEAAARLADLVTDELGLPRPGEFSDLPSAFADRPIDLVVVATPSGLHVQLAEEALAHDAHVVIEKPLDTDMGRARRIAELASAARERGVVVSVISQHRFDPASVVVQRAVTEGTLGRVTSAIASVAWWRSQNYYDSGDWRGTWALDGGGAVMNQGVHTVDLLVWFLGEPVEISAKTALLAHDGVEIEDVAVATLTFASGALAVLHATTAAYPGLSVRLQVYGSTGSAVIDDDQLSYFSAGGVDADPDGKKAMNLASDLVGESDLAGSPKAPGIFALGHLRQYEDVVDAIRTGREPAVTVDTALRSLAVVRSVYVSATLGRPVLFEEVLGGDFDDLALVTGGAA